MKSFIKFFAAILISFSVTAGAYASDCESLLSGTAVPTEIDFQTSDLEGLYIELLDDVLALQDLPQSKVSRHLETLVNKKANFLNHMVGMIFHLRRQVALKKAPAIDLTQIHNMILSVGVSPEMFDLVLNAEQQAEFAHPPEAQEQKSLEQPALSNPIGFIFNKKDAAEELPPHLHRTIGFGRGHIEAYPGPARKAGQLSIRLDESGKGLIVEDPQTRTRYHVPINVLQISGAENQDKRFQLAFNKDELEWFVSYENLANPSGKIGFQLPE